MDIRLLFLFPNYRIIVFNAITPNYYYTVKSGSVCYSPINKNADAIETEFSNRKTADMDLYNCKMLGRLDELSDEKAAKAFKEARYAENTYPDFNNPNGEKLTSAAASIRSFIQSDKWEHPDSVTWIIIPKPSKKLNGKKIETEFSIANETFTQIDKKLMLPVFYNEIKADTTEVNFSVEIPDYLYDFLMLHPEINLRPKSKVITSNSFAWLKKEIWRLSELATALTDYDNWMKKAEKVILIRFLSGQRENRDSYQHGYVGKDTEISFQFFVAYKTKRDFWSNATELWVDKHWIAGQGFVHVGRERMRAVRGTAYGTMIPWTQEREDFLTAIETNFKILSDNLNTYLKDLNPEKLDALAASNVKLLPEAK